MPRTPPSRRSACRCANLPLTLTLVNNGATLHVSVDLPLGACQTITLTAPPGHYAFYCNVPGHKDAGMVGTLFAK